MKKMDPIDVIAMLEMYADSADSQYAFECLQSLKNSEPTQSKPQQNTAAWGLPGIQFLN